MSKNKKCCKDNGPKYVVTTTDNLYIEQEPFTKEEAEDEIAEILTDYDEDKIEDKILVYRLEKVDFEVTSQNVEVEILD